jgi:hypothetical protein
MGRFPANGLVIRLFFARYALLTNSSQIAWDEFVYSGDTDTTRNGDAETIQLIDNRLPF